MDRRLDWPERLTDYLNASRERPFKWGEHDCALFVAGAIAAQTDVDFGDDWRGRYADEAEAEELLADVGGVEGLAGHYGLTELAAPQLARRGDVVLLMDGNYACLGVCDGRGGMFVTPKGLRRVRLRDCRRAWGV